MGEPTEIEVDALDVDWRATAEALQAEMNRRQDVLRRMADAWLKTGSDDAQLCLAHDFFTAVLNPPHVPDSLKA